MSPAAGALSPPGAAAPPRTLFRQEFARNLSQLMLARGWNQNELAKKANVDKGSISAYIRGITTPEGKNLKKLADVFGVAIPDLYPQSVQRAMNTEVPSINLRVSPGHPNKAWLEVNRLVDFSTAAKVIELIQASEGQT